MKIYPEQIEQELGRKLLPVYLVCGDELLLTEEATRKIRSLVKQQGFQDHQVFHVAAHFDWSPFLESSNSLSLFSENSLLELRLSSNKLTEAGRKALLGYLENPPENKVLLISSGKLDGSAKNTKWFKQLDKLGGIIQTWPITPQQLPSWIQKRFQQHNIRANSDAVRFLAEYTEGNLLATQQEIEKIALLYHDQAITADDLMRAISDSARFNVFTLMDSVLSGQAKRALKILKSLQNEGSEPTIILWAFTREIRSLFTIQNQLKAGQHQEKVFQQNRVWDKRKPMVQAALRRLSKNRLHQALKKTAFIDQCIKGLKPDNVWVQLEQLLLKLCQGNTR